MTALAIRGSAARGARLRTWVREELAPFPGRADALWRHLLSSAIVIVCSLALQLPSLALSLIFVFFTAKENTVLTRLAGALLLAGVTLAVMLSIVLLKLTIDHPLLRLVGTCAIGVCGMYFMRVSRFGSVGYLATLFVFLGQSLVDSGESAESISRGLLWIWVAAVYPIGVTILVNYLLLPARPTRLLADELRRQLDTVVDQLEVRRRGAFLRPLNSAVAERAVLVLHRHLAFATQADSSYARDKARHLMRIAAVDRLHTAAAHLSQFPVRALSPSELEAMAQLQSACQALTLCVAAGTRFISPPELRGIAQRDQQLHAVLQEMAYALHAAADADAKPPADLPKTKEGLFVADALTNPVYGRFAFKTVLAAMSCYFFYTSIQWPGIKTAMQTCIILALPSLGATTEKGVSRIVGCALGSTVSLLATVFVVPHLDSITGLLALTLPVIAVSAWIAAGSARVSYMGVQLMYAFALALLGSFGPGTDVTEIRDRLVGILVGLVAIISVFTLVWPEREGSMLKPMLARLLRAIAGLAAAGREAMGEMQKRQAVDKARLQGWSLLSQNAQLQARVALEPEWHLAHDSVTGELTTMLARAQEILISVNFLEMLVFHARAAMPQAAAQAFSAYQDAIAAQLHRIAGRLDATPAAAELDAGDLLLAPLSILDRLLADTDRADAFFPPLEELVSAAHGVHSRISQLDQHDSQPDTSDARRA